MNISIHAIKQQSRRISLTSVALKHTHSCPVSTAKLLTSQQVFDSIDQTEKIKPFDSIPGPKGLPLIGSSYKYLPGFEYDARDIYKSHKRKFDQYGTIVKENLHGRIIVHLFDPSDFEVVFRHEGKYPVRGEIRGIKKYREERNRCIGLMNLQGEDWHRLRSQVAHETLKPHRVATYIGAQEPVANDLVKIIQMKRDVFGEVNNLLNDLYRWSMESIGVFCFDTRLGTLDEVKPTTDVQNLINAVGTFMEKLNILVYFWKLHQSGKTKTWHHFCNSMDTIWQISVQHFQESVSRLSKNSKDTFLSRMINSNMTNEEAVTMINDLFFASIDTAAHCMGFLLYHLARNPEKQELLYQQIKENVPKDEPLSNEILARLPYLKACVRESIRLCPVIGTASRNISTDIVLGGYHIPKGTAIMAHSMFTAKHEEYFKNADKYIPERWLRGNEQYHNSNPYAFLPFGYGGRGCTGRRIAEQQIYLATIKLMENFRIEYHHDDIGLLTRTVNKPNKPLKFAFIDR